MALDAAFHQQEYLRLCQLLEAASQTSQLPVEPAAQAALHDLLLRLRLGQTS